MRRLGIAMAVLAGVLVAAAIGAVVFLARIDPAQVTDAIEAEVQRSTGRTLAVGGPIRLRLLPEMTIDADDVSLANPEGFSRPAMITVRHLHAAVALLPLLSHRVVVRSLVLTAPDLKLEQPASGQPNWRFTRERRSAALPDPVPPQHAGRLRLEQMTVLGLSISDGTVGWAIGGAAGRKGQVLLSSAELHEVNASSTIHVAISAVLAGDPVTLSGRLGGQTHLWDAADPSPWPVELTLASLPAGSIWVAGTITAPLKLSGYDVAVQARGPDLGRLAAAFPGLDVPRLHGVALQTRLIDRVDGLDMPRLALTADASDLGAFVDGLSLNRLAIDAPNIDGIDGALINHVSADGQYAGQALQLDARLGAVGRLFGRGQIAAQSPIAVDATAVAAGARLTLRGKVAPNGDWAGTDTALQVSIPDLAALSRLARRTLPHLHGIVAQATIRSAGGVLSLHAAQLQSAEAQLTAEGSAHLGGRPRYEGNFAIARLDLDAVQQAWKPDRRSDAAAPAAAAAQSLAPQWVIPDRAFDVGALQAADADVRFSAGALVSHGVTISDVAGHIRLDQGRLGLDPMRLTIGATPVVATLAIDAGRTPPALALGLHATGLDVALLLVALGVPPAAAGTLDVDAAMTGAGATPHTIAGTLDGHLGVAFTHGEIDNRLLAQAVGFLVPATRLAAPIPASGRSDIVCLATRLELQQGVAAPRVFLLDTGKLRLTAAGAIDLRNETFALRLRPYVRLGPVGLVLPSRADGSWRAPHFTLEPSNGASSGAAIVAGLVAGRNDGSEDKLGGIMAGLTGAAETLLAESDSGDCGQALAFARDTSGMLAKPVPPPPPASRRERTIDLLRRLLHVSPR